jgi:hypothetical protein
MEGCPILWKAHKEGHINRSSCEAEIKATDECIKNAQMLRIILSDLVLLDTSMFTLVCNDTMVLLTGQTLVKLI